MHSQRMGPICSSILHSECSHMPPPMITHLSVRPRCSSSELTTANGPSSMLSMSVFAVGVLLVSAQQHKQPAQVAAR